MAVIHACGVTRMTSVLVEAGGVRVRHRDRPDDGPQRSAAHLDAEGPGDGRARARRRWALGTVSQVSAPNATR